MESGRKEEAEKKTDEETLVFRSRIGKVTVYRHGVVKTASTRVGQKAFVREYSVLSRARDSMSDSVVQLTRDGVSVEPESGDMQMRLRRYRTDLFTVLTQPGFRVTTKARIRLIRLILITYMRLWQRRICHCDPKPENILIDGDQRCSDKDLLQSKSLRVIICDFGMAKVLDISGTISSSTMLFTPVYSPPEYARARTSLDALKAEMFSVGMTLLAVCGARGVGRDRELHDYREWLAENIRDRLPSAFVSKTMAERAPWVPVLLNALLKYRPEERPTLEAIARMVPCLNHFASMTMYDPLRYHRLLRNADIGIKSISKAMLCGDKLLPAAAFWTMNILYSWIVSSQYIPFSNFELIASTVYSVVMEFVKETRVTLSGYSWESVRLLTGMFERDDMDIARIASHAAASIDRLKSPPTLSKQMRRAFLVYIACNTCVLNDAYVDEIWQTLINAYCDGADLAPAYATMSEGYFRVYDEYLWLSRLELRNE